LLAATNWRRLWFRYSLHQVLPRRRRITVVLREDGVGDAERVLNHLLVVARGDLVERICAAEEVDVAVEPPARQRLP
jgi:hypothetical protein